MNFNYTAPFMHILQLYSELYSYAYGEKSIYKSFFRKIKIESIPQRFSWQPWEELSASVEEHKPFGRL